MKRFFINRKAKYFVSAMVLIPLGLMGECKEELKLNPDQYITQLSRSAKRQRQKRRNKKSKSVDSYNKHKVSYDSGKWVPSFTYINNIQEKKSPFFQFNVGVGFLYFSDISSNLGGAPSSSFLPPNAPAPNFVDVPFQGKLNYNRTPLFEALIGYRLFPWFKFALSYQHQGNISINTDALKSANTNAGKASFHSNLNLDAIMAKFYLELPWPMIVKNVATSPYLAVGVGPGWQSWTRVQVQYYDVVGNFRNRYTALNDKISANAVWMLDLGFRLQDAVRHQKFSVTLGCKYNQWGQATNIGALKDQDQLKLGLSEPFKIKTVFSFAPYLGAQWNFPSSNSIKTPIIVNGRDANSWIPFWVSSGNFTDPGIWTQLNVGVGFLYFNGAKGVVVADGATPTPTVGRPTQFGPYRGGFSYNRTPLIEFLLGWRILPFLRAGLSLQTQGQVTVQSNWQTATGAITNGVNPVDQPHIYKLSSSLNLNSVMLRFYLDSPLEMLFKSIAFTPYLGGGFGGGWQSWNNITIQDVIVNPGNSRNNNPRFLRRKTSANAVWLLDIGTKLKSVLPKTDFSLSAGVKFNYWGQARNIGKLSQQGGNKQFLVRPLTIKYVYSFAPYLGVQWNFPNNFNFKKPYTIDGRRLDTWTPFWTEARNIQDKTSLWTQFNMGVGFLYFSTVRGTITGVPGDAFNYEAKGKDFNGKLSYNRTPLFEYLLGYRFNNWVKAALSYQHQANVSVQSQPQDARLPVFTTNSLSKITFRSNLELDAILAKGVFELPFALIFKSVAMSPYLGLGVGLGWQTWESTVQHIQFDTGFINYITQQPLQRKISANCVWMVDLGVESKSAFPNSPFSVLLGCKYNQWGQARNLGELSQQGTLNVGLSRPLRIKTVYQFAPYIGAQWNF